MSQSYKKQKIDTQENAQILNYIREHDKYISTFPTQQTRLFLWRMSMDTSVPRELKQFPYLSLLAEVTKEMMLNDLELAMFSLIAEAVIWRRNSKITSSLLRYAAYSAKCYMNEDMEMIQMYLSQKHKGFVKNYQKWLSQNQHFIKINPKILNDKYNSLAVPLESDSFFINYNYYVDEILQSANSGCFENEICTESQLEEEDDIPLPELMTLDSVFKETEHESNREFISLGFAQSLGDDEIEFFNLEPLYR